MPVVLPTASEEFTGGGQPGPHEEDRHHIDCSADQQPREHSPALRFILDLIILEVPGATRWIGVRLRQRRLSIPQARRRSVARELWRLAIPFRTRLATAKHPGRINNTETIALEGFIVLAAWLGSGLELRRHDALRLHPGLS